MAAGALGLTDAAAFFQSGVERVEGSGMRHGREEVCPGILHQGIDLASHEDSSCQSDLNLCRYLERSAGPSLQHRTARMPRHLTSGRRLDGCTIIPHAGAIGSEGCDQSYQRRVCFSQTKSRFTLPHPTRLAESADSCISIVSCTSRDLQCGSFWYFAERGEAPERNKKLTRERDDRNSAMATPVAFDAVLEP